MVKYRYVSSMVSMTTLLSLALKSLTSHFFGMACATFQVRNGSPFSFIRITLMSAGENSPIAKRRQEPLDHLRVRQHAALQHHVGVLGPHRQLVLEAVLAALLEALVVVFDRQAGHGLKARIVRGRGGCRRA